MGCFFGDWIGFSIAAIVLKIQPIIDVISWSLMISGLLALFITIFYAYIVEEKVLEGTAVPTKGGQFIYEYKGGVNHVVGFESVGGILYLTASEMIFKPHAINLQKKDWIMSYRNIDNVQTGGKGTNNTYSVAQRRN